MRVCAELAVKLAAQPVYDGAGDWAALMRNVDADMRTLIRKWKAGMDAQAWYIQFDSVLFDGHAGSHIIGQEQGGTSPSKALARLIAREIADEEEFFLRGFIRDLISGRYVVDGEFMEERAMTRARLYQGKMRGTAARGFVDSSPRDARFEWVLGAVEEHCTDCPDMASLSQANPFTKTTMFQHPGDGSTPCLGNCKCHWVRLTDGEHSQKAT